MGTIESSDHRPRRIGRSTQLETRSNAASQDLSSQQWKSGAAAWLGWLFDGLDMHLYVLVATPFVAGFARRGNKKDPLGLTTIAPGFRPPFFSAGRSAADSSGASPIDWAVVVP